MDNKHQKIDCRICGNHEAIEGDRVNPCEHIVCPVCKEYFLSPLAFTIDWVRYYPDRVEALQKEIWEAYKVGDVFTIKSDNEWIKDIREPLIKNRY